MPDPAPVLTRDQRKRLLTALKSIALFNKSAGRDLLLTDLPAPLQDNIERSDTKAVDLTNIVEAARNWGPLPDGTSPILILLENARSLVATSAAGRELDALYEELRALPPPPAVVPPPAARALLAPADPATVVLAAIPQDAAWAARLARALQLRGLRVVRDSAERPLLAGGGQALVEKIAHRCDAVVLILSEAARRSDVLGRVAVEAALNRHRQDTHFAVIPLLLDRPAPLSEADGPGWAALEAFYPVRLAGEPPAPAAWADLAGRVLRAALTGRAERAPAEEGMTIRLRTFADTRAIPRLDLDLDWIALYQEYGGADPPPEVWAAELLPALADAADALSYHSQPGGVTAWVKARLPAAVALGWRFPPKGSVALRWRRDAAEVWSSAGPVAPADDLQVETVECAPASVEWAALVELAFRRDVRPAVDTWLATAGVFPRWRVTALPQAGLAEQALRTPEQARAWAWRIGRALRDLWDPGLADAVHLFLDGPGEFAGLVGEQLYDHASRQHPIHVYAHTGNSYRLAYILGAPPAA